MNLAITLLVQETTSDAEALGENVGQIFFYVLIAAAIIFYFYKRGKNKKK